MKISCNCATVVGFGIFAAIGLAQAVPASAGIADSVFATNPDGSVLFDVRNVPRREVLDRLLAGKSIELDWVDLAYADERISGAFNGTSDAVLGRLLAQTDYVIVYDRKSEQPRIARLIIIGKSTSQSKSVQLPSLNDPKSRPAATPPIPGAQALRPLSGPVGPVVLTPPAAGETAPVLTPPPAGEAPPLLVPPTGADVKLPLTSAPPNTTVPNLLR